VKWKRVDSWEGGYVRQRVDESGKPTGAPVFVIEKEIHGARFHVSTRCTDRQRAMRHLVRFEADPSTYTPAGSDARLPDVRLTAQLVGEYRAFQLEKGITSEWAAEVVRCLADWIDALGPVDLRKVSLHQHLKPALEAWPKRRSQRIKALKGFFKWLRTEKGLIKHAEDATLDLRVPQARPEKFRRRKVVAHEDVQAALLKLKPPFSDILHVLAGTGLHVSEIRRLVLGQGEVVETTKERPVAVILVRQKSGEMTRARLEYPEYLDSMRRLMARGSFPNRMGLARAMKAACDAAGVPRFGMGVMRHSFLTWAHEDGAEMGALKEAANHRTEATTRRFYVDAAIPVGVLPIRRLQR
jgi:integrase